MNNETLDRHCRHLNAQRSQDRHPLNPAVATDNTHDDQKMGSLKIRRRSHFVPGVVGSKRGGTYHTEDMSLRLPFEELDIARPTDREGAKLFDEAEDASEIAMEAQAVFYEAAKTLDEKTM